MEDAFREITRVLSAVSVPSVTLPSLSVKVKVLPFSA